VLFDQVAQALGDGVLPGLDLRIDELFHRAAVHTHDMVMVGAVVDLEHRHAVLEMMPAHQPRPLELGQYPVDRGQADVLAGVEQFLVDLFGRHVPRRAVLEDLEYFQPRQRDLEPGLA
jgi:hypothetical protein